MSHDPFDPDTDPFRPPAVPTEVSCLHCGQTYDSSRIEWRVETAEDGSLRGFWCCPISGCGGVGFGFDILPTDPEYHDEHGGWVSDSETAEDDSEDADLGTGGNGVLHPPSDEDDDIPF
jgi:hypothetical protein